MKYLAITVLLLCELVSTAQAMEWSYLMGAAAKFEWAREYGEAYQRAHSCLVDKHGRDATKPPAGIEFATQDMIMSYVRANCMPVSEPKQEAANGAVKPATMRRPVQSTKTFTWPAPAIGTLIPFVPPADGTFKARWGAFAYVGTQ